VDDDCVQPQPGGFYGGWITPDLEGRLKVVRAPGAGRRPAELSLHKHDGSSV
jgi:hypothetical protein